MLIHANMTMQAFFSKNSEELKKLSSEAKQRIENFWKEDFDKYVTNEIEVAILKGFTADKGNAVAMPRGNKSLFIRNNNMDDSKTDIFISESNGLSKVPKEYKEHELYYDTFSDTHDEGDIKRERMCNWSQKSGYREIYREYLIDRNDDGFADVRYVKTPDGYVHIDKDLDGKFDVTYKESYGEKYIPLEKLIEQYLKD